MAAPSGGSASQHGQEEDFDQALIEEAEEAAAEFYPISLGAVKKIWEKACASTSGHGITERGWRTLEHIAKEHPLDRMAELFLTQALKNGKELRRPEQRVEETEEEQRKKEIEWNKVPDASPGQAPPLKPFDLSNARQASKDQQHKGKSCGNFRPGQRVRLLGLRKTVDLNDRLGWLDHFDHGSGRWVMILEDDPYKHVCGKIFWRIQPCNIVPELGSLLSEPAKLANRRGAAPKSRNRAQTSGNSGMHGRNATNAHDSHGFSGITNAATQKAFDHLQSQIVGATDMPTILRLKKKMAQLLQVREKQLEKRWVIVNGIRGRPDLDGAVGITLEFDVKTDQWIVQVDGGYCYRVHKDNLQPATTKEGIAALRRFSDMKKKPAGPTLLPNSGIPNSGPTDQRERLRAVLGATLPGSQQLDEKKQQAATITAEELEDIGFDDLGQEAGASTTRAASVLQPTRRGRGRPPLKRPAAEGLVRDLAHDSVGPGLGVEDRADSLGRPRKVRRFEEDGEEENEGEEEDAEQEEGEEEEEEENDGEEEEEEAPGEDTGRSQGDGSLQREPRKTQERPQATFEERRDERREARYHTKHDARHSATGSVERPVDKTWSQQAERQNSRPSGTVPGRPTHKPLERLAIRPIERLVNRQMSQANEKAAEERRAAVRMAGSSALERAAHIKQEKDDEAVLAVRKLFEMPWETSQRIAKEQQRVRQQQQQELHRQVILHQQTSLVQRKTEAKTMSPHLGRLATTDGRRCISTVRSPAKRKAPLPLDLRTQQKLLFMKRPAAACDTVQTVALRRPAGRR